MDLPQTIYGTINGIRLEFWVTLYTGMARVDIETEVLWDTYNVRLRMGVKTAAKGKNLYEIPYGVLQREAYTPTYLHEPDAYSMRAFDGMRDSGHHRFCFALVSYSEPLENTRIMADAHGFNSGLYAGAGRISQCSLPQNVLRAEKTNMLEDAGQVLPLNENGEAEWEICPFEIVTVKLFTDK